MRNTYLSSDLSPIAGTVGVPSGAKLGFARRTTARWRLCVVLDARLFGGGQQRLEISADESER